MNNNIKYLCLKSGYHLTQDTEIPEAYTQSREFVFFPSKNGHKQKIHALNGF